jgi:hypothetical protein
VHPVDQVPVLLLHVLEADIAQDAGVVDEHIDAAKGVDGRLDDGLSVLDRVVVGHGFAACGFDLVDDCICGLVLSVKPVCCCWSRCQTDLRALALALEAPSKVVDHHVCAAAAEEDGILATQATAGACHDHRLAVVPQLLRSHCRFLPVFSYAHNLQVTVFWIAKGSEE